MVATHIVNREVVDRSGILIVEKPQMRPDDAITEKEKATVLVVGDVASRGRAAFELVRLKALMEEAHARFDPIVEKANATHKEACKQRNAVVQPLEEAYRLIGGKVGAFDLAERRREEDEERRLLEESRVQAAEVREEEIETAEANGASSEEIAALCDMPLTPAPVIAQRRVAAGPVTTRAAYKARLVNKFALVQFIAKNAQYLNLLDINQSALNNVAKALGTAMQLPGVELVQEAGVVTRLSARGGK